MMHCLAYDVEQDYSDILRPWVVLKCVFMAFPGSNTHLPFETFAKTEINSIKRKYD